MGPARIEMKIDVISLESMTFKMNDPNYRYGEMIGIWTITQI